MNPIRTPHSPTSEADPRLDQALDVLALAAVAIMVTLMFVVVVVALILRELR